ncbi:MAG: hypothetical protein CL903_05160 [Dehalococcoidia bacterium]|nr:hypothetical protein [Dehalococcoidia bacterium]MQG09464.1 hypothetical protein [SAR202 cluster bacterium]|tara:strand:+ start:4125 stop:5321 length:1197 start_codon:yes stop_codon:yes gene_type:complete
MFSNNEKEDSKLNDLNDDVVDRSEFSIGQRSIQQSIKKSRMDYLRESKENSSKSRPYFIFGIIIVIILLLIPAYSYFQIYVFPPRELALRVEDKEYSRGDVVNFIRYNQRISEDLGVPFQVGNSLFDAMLTLQENELSYQLAPKYGISVSKEEVDERFSTTLGFVAFNASDDPNLSTEDKVNLDEAKRQFINKIGVTEDDFRDFIKKSMFRERLREVVGQSVPKLQVQVHIYEIILFNTDNQIQQKIDRELKAGDPIEDIVMRYSENPNKKRDLGEIGWFPYGTNPELDGLLFGLDKDGNRLLPIRETTSPRYNEEKKWHSYIVVNEVSEAREVDEENMELLVDRAMTLFLNEERKNFDLKMVLDSDIFEWVNKQVKMSSLLPTPTAVSYDFSNLPGN